MTKWLDDAHNLLVAALFRETPYAVGALGGVQSQVYLNHIVESGSAKSYTRHF